MEGKRGEGRKRTEGGGVAKKNGENKKKPNPKAAEEHYGQNGKRGH